MMGEECKALRNAMSDVAVIIVNLNSGDMLLRCLDSLAKQHLPVKEIIVVDNGSTDMSAMAIETRYPEVKVIRLDNNIGFAAANNRAVSLVSKECELIALLNPDAFPEPGWLEELVSAASRYSRYAAFGSRLMKEHDHSLCDGAGDVYHMSGLAWRSAEGTAPGEADLVPREVFSPCAAAVLYRKGAFLEAGGFDEDFFCYMEDVDLGFRLRLLGYRALYLPDSIAFHVGSATTGEGSDFSVYHGHRNLVWTYVKNMPGPLFWTFLPLHLALNLASIVWYALRHRGAVIARAKRDALRRLPLMWQKRRKIQKGRRVSMLAIARLFDRGIVPLDR